MPQRRTLLPFCHSRRLPRASGDVPTCCHQRGSWISSLLLFLAQEMENTQRAGHNQRRPKGPKKAFRERPPVPPRRWNKSVPFYAGQWKRRTGSCILLKCGRVLLELVQAGRFHASSPGLRWEALMCARGGSGGCTPPSKRRSLPHLKSRNSSRPQRPASAPSISILTSIWPYAPFKLLKVPSSPPFHRKRQRIAGFRKEQLGRIARNRSQTGIIAENEQDNADLAARKIRT